MRDREILPNARRRVPMLAVGALFFSSAIASGFLQQWGNTLIALALLPLMSLPWLAERRLQMRLPLNLVLQYAVLILAGPYIGGYWGLYVAWPAWDTWVHLYSGIFLSVALVLGLGRVLDAYRLVLPVWLELVILVTTKAFLALLWEIAEFSFDLIFDAHTQDDNHDTMTDMIAALGPSLVVAAALYVHRRHRPLRYIASLLAAGRAPRAQS